MCIRGLFKFFCNKNDVSDTEVCHDYGFDRDYENSGNSKTTPNTFINNEIKNEFNCTEAEAFTILNLNKYCKSSAPKLHTMNGKELWCKIIDVYDGDTVDIIFYMANELLHYKFRLYGIDTPELKPLKIIANRNEIIERAKEAKLYLETLVLNKIVYIRFKNEEKYGRLMGNIYFSKSENQKSINQMMIESGFAVEYYGQKK
jgi:endonuclease YncB( thermonuclease family)